MTPRHAPSATLTGTGHDLNALLRPVLVHATRHDVGLLGHVHIEVRDREAFIIATDGYTLGVVRTELGYTTGDSFDLHLPASVLRPVLATVPARHRMTAHLAANGLDIEYADPSTSQTLPGATCRIPSTRHMSGVPWRRLVTSATADLDATTTHTPVNSAYLARFHTGTENELVLHGAGRARQPVLVTNGSNHIGLIMPLDMPADAATDVLADWQASCAVTGENEAA